MKKEQSRVSRRFCMALIVGGVIGMIGILVVEGYGAGYGGLAHRCIVEGPFPTTPALAPVTEAGPERAYVSLWPFGLACDWERADGQGVVTAYSDWSATAGFLVCAAMAIGGGVFIGRRPGERLAANAQ